MKKQRGGLSLVTVAVLLTSLLLLVLGSYRVTFHQIKVAQNELKMRRIHWLAEGAIECGYSFIRVMDADPSKLFFASYEASYQSMQHECLSDLSHEALFSHALSASRYQLSYQYDGTTRLNRAIELDTTSGEYRWLKGTWNDY
ncbi:hypothetical protein JCM19238_4528 [Vibrio ponticus]|nr:hypothetical protein JCM19238_4528 [Vibrio ponticus]